jgi:hypothetical protein
MLSIYIPFDERLDVLYRHCFDSWPPALVLLGVVSVCVSFYGVLPKMNHPWCCWAVLKVLNTGEAFPVRPRIEDQRFLNFEVVSVLIKQLSFDPQPSLSRDNAN